MTATLNTLNGIYVMILAISSGCTLGKDLREDKRCIEVVKHKDTG